MDNGPVSRSKVFQSVMGSLGVRMLTHMPPSEAERRTPARSKGKVERLFRTIKEVHETLYHSRLNSKDEAEANSRMRAAPWSPTTTAAIAAEPHSRVEDWLKPSPSSVRAMCSWERFCGFAREPERRTVAGDATVSVEGLVRGRARTRRRGGDVAVGLDQELFVEFEGKRFGPYQPSRSGPALPLPKIPEEPGRGTPRQGRTAGRPVGLLRAAVGGDRPLPSCRRWRRP